MSEFKSAPPFSLLTFFLCMYITHGFSFSVYLESDLIRFEVIIFILFALGFVVCLSICVWLGGGGGRET